MRKRIGTKLYDTEAAICILPAANLYKQQNKRTFFIFDGENITPITIEQAADIIRGAGDPELEKVLQVKPSNRGCMTLGVTLDRYNKLERYARSQGRSMKSIIEEFIDGLPEVE